MNNAALRAARDLAQKEDENSILNYAPMTAHEMAETPHTLSRDGSMATEPNGNRWVWGERYSEWVRWA